MVSHSGGSGGGDGSGGGGSGGPPITTACVATVITAGVTEGVALAMFSSPDEGDGCGGDESDTGGDGSYVDSDDAVDDAVDGDTEGNNTDGNNNVASSQ